MKNIKKYGKELSKNEIWDIINIINFHSINIVKKIVIFYYISNDEKAFSSS